MNKKFEFGLSGLALMFTLISSQQVLSSEKPKSINVLLQQFDDRVEKALEANTKPILNLDALTDAQLNSNSKDFERTFQDIEVDVSTQIGYLPFRRNPPFARFAKRALHNQACAIYERTKRYALQIINSEEIFSENLSKAKLMSDTYGYPLAMALRDEAKSKGIDLQCEPDYENLKRLVAAAIDHDVCIYQDRFYHQIKTGEALKQGFTDTLFTPYSFQNYLNLKSELKELGGITACPISRKESDKLAFVNSLGSIKKSRAAVLDSQADIRQALENLQMASQTVGEAKSVLKDNRKAYSQTLKKALKEGQIYGLKIESVPLPKAQRDY